MIRHLCLNGTVIFLLLLTPCNIVARNLSPQPYSIVFYNVENLFDTFDDSLTTDEEFTPRGAKHWSRKRMDLKVKMIYRAILAASKGKLPEIIGLAEIENLWILEYLLKNTPLVNYNYQIIHKESPDFRGIDVALLYQGNRIKPLDYRFITVNDVTEPAFKTREILEFTALLGDEKFYFFVNHWPSRSGGYLETIERRDLAASTLRKRIDTLIIKEPKSKLIMMGDFNATPDESCFTEVLMAVHPSMAVSPQLSNLSFIWLKKGEGTIRTKGLWEIFDQLIVSNNLLNGKGLKIDLSRTIICKETFLMENELTYLGKKPFRTYYGPVYHGGISDHLPIATCLF